MEYSLQILTNDDRLTARFFKMIPKSHFELGIAPEPEDIEMLLRRGQRDAIPTHADIAVANRSREKHPSSEEIQSLIYERQVFFCVAVMRILRGKDTKFLSAELKGRLLFLSKTRPRSKKAAIKHLQMAQQSLKEFDRALPHNVYQEVEQAVEERMEGIYLWTRMQMSKKISALRLEAEKLPTNQEDTKKMAALDVLCNLKEIMSAIGNGEISYDRTLQEAVERKINRVEMLLEEIARSTPSPSNAHSQSADRPSLPVRGN